MVPLWTIIPWLLGPLLWLNQVHSPPPFDDCLALSLRLDCVACHCEVSSYSALSFNVGGPGFPRLPPGTRSGLLRLPSRCCHTLHTHAPAFSCRTSETSFFPSFPCFPPPPCIFLRSNCLFSANFALPSPSPNPASGQCCLPVRLSGKA